MSEMNSFNRSTMSTGSSANMCSKHPGYELTYFNAKEGRKQCLMCIMRASVAESGKEKERFCVKHPGYENSFYCTNDQKVCCEKCLVYHKKHKVESIALKAETLREKFDEYKTSFTNASKEWNIFYNTIKTRKDSVENEIEKTSKTIEDVFDAMIEKLKKRKLDSINSFKKKAWGMLQEFIDKYKECDSDIKDISKKNEEFGDLGQLFSTGDNMELITKAMELNLEDLMDNYCPFLDQKLDQHKKIFSELKSKSNYTFSIANNFNEEEVNDFINKQFVVKIAKSEKPDLPENFVQPLSPEPGESTVHENSPPLNEEKAEDLTLHKFDAANKMIWLYQNQTFINSPLPIMKSPVKTTKSATNVPKIENWNELRTYKSTSGETYGYEATDKGINTIYRYIPDTMSFEPVISLPYLYRKISILEQKGILYIGGEPCEIAEEARFPPVLACDLLHGTVESLGSGLPKMSGFVLALAKQKYLYLIPLALHNEKIYRTNLEKIKSEEKEELEEQKSGIKERHMTWEQIVYKNPKNLVTQLFAPVWTVEISDDSILILTGKGSLVFNWKDASFIEYSNLKQKDEFTDGAYKVDDQVCAYGKLGVHSYSITTGKWNFIPQQIPKA